MNKNLSEKSISAMINFPNQQKHQKGLLLKVFVMLDMFF